MRIGIGMFIYWIADALLTLVKCVVRMLHALAELVGGKGE